jgi:hypothetical protein
VTTAPPAPYAGGVRLEGVAKMLLWALIITFTLAVFVAFGAWALESL